MQNNKLIEIFFTALKLGVLSFGGPIAHLGYFHEEYVKRKKWLDEKRYADIVALCNFLPGPSSSQVGLSIGYIRGGMLGSFFSWLGFTLPTFIGLVLFGLLIQSSTSRNYNWVHGLKIVAVSVVAHAVYNMFKNLVKDKFQKMIFLLSTCFVLIFPNSIGQLSVLVLSGFIGYIVYKNEDQESKTPVYNSFNKKWGIVSFILFLFLLIGLPFLNKYVHNSYTNIANVFYRTGSFVFGGGHVVLPLLQTEFTGKGLLSTNEFLAGYGVTQAMPGPIFTFSAYIGTLLNGIKGAVTATLFMFLPSFLLVFSALPYWENLRGHSIFRAALKGVNASVVGILFAAFYNPIFTSSILSSVDFVIAVFGFMLLEVWKLASWKVVCVVGILGWLSTYL